jgi:hypothetical protein
MNNKRKMKKKKKLFLPGSEDSISQKKSLTRDVQEDKQAKFSERAKSL